MKTIPKGDPLTLKDIFPLKNENISKTILTDYIIRNDKMFKHSILITLAGFYHSIPLYKCTSKNTCVHCHGTLGILVNVEGITAYMCIGISCLHKLISE